MTRTPLYPLDSLSSRDSDNQENALTVLINRTVSLDDEKDFLEVLKVLLQEFDHASGTLGNKVFRSTHATHVEFSIIQRFANAAAHDAWLNSASFVRWQSEVAPEEPDPHHIRRYSGMEALFASGKDPDSPPQWKWRFS